MVPPSCHRPFADFFGGSHPLATHGIVWRQGCRPFGRPAWAGLARQFLQVRRRTVPIPIGRAGRRSAKNSTSISRVTFRGSNLLLGESPFFKAAGESGTADRLRRRSPAGGSRLEQKGGWCRQHALGRMPATQTHHGQGGVGGERSARFPLPPPENGRPTRNQSVPALVVTMTAIAPSSPRAATSTARTSGSPPASTGSIASTKAAVLAGGRRRPQVLPQLSTLVACGTTEPGRHDAGLRFGRHGQANRARGGYAYDGSCVTLPSLSVQSACHIARVLNCRPSCPEFLR